MCKALEFTQMMNDKVIEAKNYHYTLGKKLSMLDMAQQDLLHKIENLDKFNLMDAWEITKALNELRHERRKIKDDLETMSIFMNMFIQNKNIDIILNNTIIQLTDKNTVLKNRYENKVYTNKTLNNSSNPLESTENMLKNLNERNFNIYKNLLENGSEKKEVKAINNMNISLEACKNSINSKSILKIYNFGEKVLKNDKGIGSSMKIKYGTQKQYNSILNILVPQYKTFSINTIQKYFHLINKKF